MDDKINNPLHYGGKNNQYEAIKVIEAWELNFCLGNVLKYISRAGKKENNSSLQDLKKAQWYLQREISKYAQIPEDPYIEAKRSLGCIPTSFQPLKLKEEYDTRQKERKDTKESSKDMECY